MSIPWPSRRHPVELGAHDEAEKHLHQALTLAAHRRLQSLHPGLSQVQAAEVRRRPLDARPAQRNWSRKMPRFRNYLGLTLSQKECESGRNRAAQGNSNDPGYASPIINLP